MIELIEVLSFSVVLGSIIVVVCYAYDNYKMGFSVWPWKHLNNK